MIAARWRLPEASRPSRASSRGTAALACVLALLSGAPGTVRAGVLPILEPGGRPLCTGQPGLRLVTAVLPDGSGGQFLITTDDRSAEFTSGEGMDVFLMHLDAMLDLVPFSHGPFADSPCGALLFGGQGTQWAPRAAAPSRGRLVLAIESLVPWSGEAARVLVQEYDASGRGLFGPYPVPISEAGVESVAPLVLPDGEGGLFFAWSAQPEVHPSLLGDFLLQHLDGGARPLWDRPAVLSGGPYGGRVMGSLALDGAGGVYASWSEPSAGGSGPHPVIRVQRVGRDGTPLWPRGGVRPWDGEFADDLVSHVVPDGAGGVVVVFASGEARAQRLSAEGERLWGGQGIVLSLANVPGDSATLGTALEPGVVLGEDGVLFVTWLEQHGSGLETIAGRRLGRDGRLPWPGPLVLAGPAGSIGRRSEALLPDGSLAIVWEDSRPLDPLDPQDLRIQAIDRRCRLKAPPEGAPLAVVPGRQQVPFVIASGGSAEPPRALVVWTDSRSAALDAWHPSWAIDAQVVEIISRPIVPPVPAVPLREGDEVTIVLRGVDLHTGLAAGAGEDVTIAAGASPDSVDLPGDTLTLRVSAGPHASPGPRAVTIVNPDGGATTIPGLLAIELDPRRPDIDRSGRVDGFDLAVLARSFGREKGEDAYAPAADVDADGRVDGTDLAMLAARFGRSPLAPT